MDFKRKMKSMSILALGSSLAFSALNIYKENEQFYKDFVIPAIHLLDPETAHRLGVLMCKHRVLPKNSFDDPELLNVNFLGKKLSNPIGMAAGFDKHGEAVMGLQDMGFGFVEIGSVTPQPQPGNDKPRVFRLKEDYAIFNKYGFNSDGHGVVYDRLAKLKNDASLNVMLGVNLGKNKESEDAINDYVLGIKKFGDIADYIVINISSPNTAGLRNMQSKDVLKDLLKAVVSVRNSLSENNPPILLKLSPDLSHEERRDIAKVIQLKECKVDGLIVSNTVCVPDKANKQQTGGLSGQPIKDVSTEMISEMYKLTNGITIIGVGGVFSGKDALDKIKAGATVVQIYTSLVYEGPLITSKIKSELVTLLKTEQVTDISEIIGSNVK